MSEKQSFQLLHLAGFHQKLREFVASLIVEGTAFASTLTKTPFGYLLSLRHSRAALFSFESIDDAKGELDAAVSVTLGNIGKELDTSLAQEGEEFIYTVRVSPLRNQE